MKLNSLTIGLVFGIAFLAVANVQADLLTAKPTADSGYKWVPLDSYSVSYNGEALVASGGDLQRNTGADLFGNLGWSFSVAAPNDYSHFSLSRGTNGGYYGPINLSINGKENSITTFMDLSFNEWWYTAYMNDALFDWTIYFNDKADNNGLLDLDFLTTSYESFTSDGNPDFVLTFYGQSPIDGQTSTPEPATLMVLGLGLTGLGISSRLRRFK